MADDKGEYEETKVRVYKTTHHKDEKGGFDKYFVKPISKALGMTPKEKRLTA